MSNPSAEQLREAATKRGSRLKFPKLLALVALLFLIDMVVPDFVPFIDEIILGLMTAILACLREKTPAKEEALNPDSDRLPPGQS